MRSQKHTDTHKQIGVKRGEDDERAFRLFLIVSFASLAVLTLIAGIVSR